MNDPRWLTLLRSAVERYGSIQALADELDYSRTTLSLVLSGQYGDRSTVAIERRVLAKLDLTECPHLRAEITRAVCDGHSRRKMPQSHPDQLRHWMACQRCPVRAATMELEEQSRRFAHG